MKPNVFVLTIDSLRGDEVFQNNNKTSLTPNLDKLIKNGTYFKQAISTADGTGVSLGSLFSASYPFNTGITQFKFNPKATNFFEIFQNNEYHTCVTVPDVSFIQNFIQHVIDQDTYVYDKRQSWLQLGGGIGQQILDKLETMPKTPWLYYIHLEDLHAPFHLPDEFNDEKFGETKYAQMISYIDSWIGKFLEKIDLSNTLVIISADHGEPKLIDEKLNNPSKTPDFIVKGKKLFPALEPLGLAIFVYLKQFKKNSQIKKLQKNLNEKQSAALHGRGQNHLYDESFKIPLIFAGYGIPKSKTITTQVRQIDIFPTIMEISGFEDNNYAFDGVSLNPLFNDKFIDEIPAYIETTAAQKPTALKRDLTLIGKSIGIRTSHYKYWRSRFDSKKDVYLFDLKSDPDEEKNLKNDCLDIVNQMESLLQNMLTNSIKPNSQDLLKNDDKEIEEELRKLGYL